MYLRAFIFAIYTLAFLQDEFADAHTPFRHSPIWNETWTDKLKRDLFSRYDKFARPTEHYNATTVYFSFRLYHISVNEFDSTFSAYGYTHQRWNDDKLKWNVSEYGGLKTINVGIHEVWQPDISLYNNADGSLDHYAEPLCLLYNDGTVLWVPPTKFRAFCDFDYRLWPFDTQNCSLQIGSWTYDGFKIDMFLSEKDSNEPDFLVTNSQWKVLNQSETVEKKMYPCCTEHYLLVTFSYLLQRNSVLYRSIVLAPAISIVFLILATFWLPCQSELRVTLGSCNALIITVYLIYFSFKVPFTNNPPLIVYFFAGCMCQVTLSLVVSVLVMSMAKKPYYKPLPRKIRLILQSWPGKLLGLRDLVILIQSQKPVAGQELRGKLTDDTSTVTSANSLNDGDDGDRQNIISPREDRSQLEWIIAATAIDRIAFVLFVFIFIIMAIAYIR